MFMIKGLVLQKFLYYYYYLYFKCCIIPLYCVSKYLNEATAGSVKHFDLTGSQSDNRKTLCNPVNLIL